MEDSTALMAVVGKHGLQLNRGVWLNLAGKLGHAMRDGPPPPRFSRWLTLLLSRPPSSTDDFTMFNLARTAKKLNDLAGALAVFEHAIHSEVQVTSARWPGVDDIEGTSPVDLRLQISTSAHYGLKIWNETIAPHLAEIHARALAVCVNALEARVDVRRRWEPARAAWDWDSGSRAGIEPHPQDRYTTELRPLIDGARGCLEWVAAHPDAANLRDIVERLWAYRSVLVKRLAIHAIRIGGDIDDDKLTWLFSVGAQDIQLRHEVFALLKQCYPSASPETRRATITWVQAFEPGPHVEEPHRADAKDRWQVEVLWWLKVSTPNCQLLLDAVAPIEARHADWLAVPDPDVVVKFIRHATGQRLSPVTVDELLQKPAAEWMDLFMNYKQQRPSGPDQESLWLAAQEAAKRSVVWERGLLTALVAHWDSDMWSTVIAAWSTWPDDEKLAAERLHWLGQPGMVQHHAPTVTHVLRALVAGTVKPYAASLLPRADEICLALCATLESEVVAYDGNHWLDAAINRPAGALADYLGDSLQFRPDIGSEPPTGLTADVRGLFDRLLLMKNGHVAFVRPVLARRLEQLAEIDPGWVQKTIVPWLSFPDDECFAQAWDGFLYGGRFSTDVGEMSKQAFLAAPARVARLLPGRLDDFVEVYVMYTLLAEDPLLEWVPHLVQNSDDDTRHMFARRMHWLMANEPSARVTARWNSWLRTYWERRLAGMPKPLTGGELGAMLGWPAVLPQAYAESVRLAAAMPKGVLENTELFQDLTERGLNRSEPQTTATYLITVLGWPGSDAFLYEVPDVLKEMDKSKVDTVTLHALEAAMALVGLHDVQWAAQPAPPEQ